MKFISFDGVDKSGKSTQIKKVAEWLKSEGYSVKILQDPGTTELSKIIRNILLHGTFELDKYTELFLFLAARAQLVKEEIKNAKEDYVLIDRFIDSTLFYQGIRNHNDLDLTWLLAIMSAHSIIPDITFIFDIDRETYIKRHNGIKDNQEQYELTFIDDIHEFVNSNDYYKINNNSIAHTRHLYIIDATDMVDNIFSQLKSILKKPA